MQNGQSTFLCSSPVSLSFFSFAPDLLFYCSRALDYAKIRTVLQSNLVRYIILSISYNCIFGGWGDPIYVLPLHNKLNKTKVSLFQIPTSMSKSSLRVIVLPSLTLSFLWTWHSKRWNTQTMVHQATINWMYWMIFLLLLIGQLH